MTLSLSVSLAGSSGSTCSPVQAANDAEAGRYWRSIPNQSFVQARDREATCRNTFEIDLLSGVITTTATTVRRNKRHHNGEGEQAVRSTNFFRKTRKNDLPLDLAPQETKPATSWSS